MDYRKIVLAGGWVLAVVAAALIAGISSVTAWFVVGIIALAPCFVMLHFSRGPAKTTSQSIQEARR